MSGRGIDDGGGERGSWRRVTGMVGRIAGEGSRDGDGEGARRG